MGTFSFNDLIGTVGGGAIATDLDPNTSAPTADRTVVLPDLDEEPTCSITLFAINGTTISAIPWIYEPTAAKWLQLGAAFAATPTAPGQLAVPKSDHAKMFLQITANTLVEQIGWIYGPSSAGGSAALPAGAATAARQDTGNTSLASIDTKTLAAGQAAMAASSPVVIASNQSAVPVSAASLPLPTGDSTSANQTTELASLASIDTKTLAAGQAVMASSSPVVIASNQTVIPVSDNAGSLTVDAPVGTPVFTRLSDGSAALIGQKAMTLSLPVTIASDQSVISTAVAKISSATNPADLFTNFGANATLNVKASAGNVFAVVCRNRNLTTAMYLQLHNTATTPGGAAVPLLSFLVPGAAEVAIGEDVLGADGVRFSTGIAFAFSTTEDTYTAGTAAEQKTFVRYK